MSMAINEPAPEKCPVKPTKKRWGSVPEAWEAADERSAQYNVEIVPYRCDACGFLHLTKRTGGTSEIERKTGFEVFKPTNPATRRAALRAFLGDRDSVTSAEVCEALGVTQNTTAKYMGELGWVNGKGRGARWTPPSEPVERHLHIAAPPAKVVHADFTPIEAAKSRHPSAKDVGWRNMLRSDSLAHIPLGDIRDVLAAAGIELRLQVRED